MINYSMKGLSIKNPWAYSISMGDKTIETRKWQTLYRGDLLICSSMKFDETASPNFPYIRDYFTKINGYALCVVELYDCVPMTEEHVEDAGCDIYDGAWAWKLRNIRPIKKLEIKGQLRLFNISDEIVNKIEYICTDHW